MFSGSTLGKTVNPSYIYILLIPDLMLGPLGKENGQVAKLLSFAAIKDLQCWHAVPHAQVSFLQKCFSLSISHTLHSIHSWPSCAISNILSFLDGTHELCEMFVTHIQFGRLFFAHVCGWHLFGLHLSYSATWRKGLSCCYTFTKYSILAEIVLLRLIMHLHTLVCTWSDS